MYSLNLEPRLNVKGIFLKIKEIAKKTGISESAIRFYEKIGLISERYIRRLPNGYREFSEDSLDALKEIIRLKAAGLDLDQIRSIVVDRDYVCESLRDDLEAKINLAISIIAEQQKKIETLKALKEECDLNCGIKDQTPCCT